MASKLTLLRELFTNHGVGGRLLIDNAFACYTMEDPYREIKVQGETCIPFGRYELALIWSDRMQLVIPYLLYVPNFRSIMIHPGNTEADTRGCVLVGKERGPDRVNDSRNAFYPLLEKIAALCKTQHTYIGVIRG
ncbi:MAG: hypothetical protein UMS36scaffold28_32 [Phage 59_13]|nr:MAG: hypothetical protein UMS36scaffold28_32 [Phage 59_13]